MTFLLHCICTKCILLLYPCRLPIVKVESLANNGSWVPLERSSSNLGTFGAFTRSELSLKVPTELSQKPTNCLHGPSWRVS